MLPPYYGVFGEIVKTPDNQWYLLQHGSTGGPIYLGFGKYKDPIYIK